MSSPPEAPIAKTEDVRTSAMEHAERQKKAGLSKRGLRNLFEIEAVIGRFLDQRSSSENPGGPIPMSQADNQLMRPELVEFFNAPGRLGLKPQDLTYADQGMCSKRLLIAICKLVNTIPDGFFFEDDKRERWPKPITEIKPEHIVVGNGVTGILDAVFWALLDDEEGLLVSQPHYVRVYAGKSKTKEQGEFKADDPRSTLKDAFTRNTITRDKAKLVVVQPPVPVASAKEPKEHVAPDTVKYYADALNKAEKEGTQVRSLLVCNPHNPSGAIYPRETIVALAKFAADHSLHFVVDE